jgi:hypothetical protein
LINLVNRISYFCGLLVFNYDEEGDTFSALKNEIIISKGTELPFTVKKEIYAVKNSSCDKVLLKFGITMSGSQEQDPSFVQTI